MIHTLADKPKWMRYAAAVGLPFAIVILGIPAVIFIACLSPYLCLKAPEMIKTMWWW